jgi:hypothetical protein
MANRFPFEEDFRFQSREFHGLRPRYIFMGSRLCTASAQVIEPQPGIETTAPTALPADDAVVPETPIREKTYAKR